MANDKVFRIVEKYHSGDWERARALKEIRAYPQYDQTAFIRMGNGTSYSRITAVAPGRTLEYVASAFNGWQAVKIGSQVGWVSGEYSEITTE